MTKNILLTAAALCLCLIGCLSTSAAAEPDPSYGRDEHTLVFLDFESRVEIEALEGVRIQDVEFLPSKFGTAIIFPQKGSHITVPGARAINPKQGTIEFYLSPLTDTAFYKTAARTKHIVLVYVEQVKGDITLSFILDSCPRLINTVHCNGKTYSKYAYARAWKKNEWYHVAFTWDRQFFKVFINRRNVHRQSHVGVMSTGKIIRIGSSPWGFSNDAFIMDRFRVSDIAREYDRPEKGELKHRRREE